ncbi:MAG: porin [Leptospira sp.]|nr:porin [Leptospira sp.]
MRNKYTLLMATMALTFSTQVFSQATKEKSWYDKVEFSGFVDVYYQYTQNNKQGGAVDTSRAFETYNKQFAVNAVELDIEKLADKESPWGFRIDFMNGQNSFAQERPFTTTNNIWNMNLLQQAYVSLYFPVLKGLTVDAGKMATHIGYEVLESKDNMNYTIGYIFFNTVPFIHTGARANLQVTDRLSTGLYLYNSAQGTGFTGNGDQFGYKGLSPYGASGSGSDIFSTSQHAYVDGPNPARTIGTQVKYDAVPDKFNITWNTIYGNDNVKGRPTNQEVWAAEAYGAGPLRKPSNWRQDYWFVNNLILTATPTDKATFVFDYTYGERAGQTVNAAFGWESPKLVPEAVGAPSLETMGFTEEQRAYPLGRANKLKRIYQTFGFWFKYQLTEKFALALRHERIDDSRYGGSLVVNAPLFATTPSDRYDLQAQDAAGVRPAASSLGMIRTYTVTPTYNWNENLIIKLDLRRDEGPGQQFIDEKGRPASHQNGATLGVVAKF